METDGACFLHPQHGHTHAHTHTRTRTRTRTRLKKTWLRGSLGRRFKGIKCSTLHGILKSELRSTCLWILVRITYHKSLLVCAIAYRSLLLSSLSLLVLRVHSACRCLQGLQSTPIALWWLLKVLYISCSPEYPVQLVRLCPTRLSRELYTEELHFSRPGSLTACWGIVLALSSFVLIRLLLASVLWKSRSCFTPNCIMGIKQ